MAIDLKTSLEPAVETSVIENEIPAYRAISARAVASVALGLASVFCFTSLYFLLLVVASVLFGWSALRAIRRMPDFLTGSGLAKTGIGLALVFGLSASSRVLVEGAMLDYEASQFAKQYVTILKSESLEKGLWYLQTVAFRGDKSPEIVSAEIKKAKSPGGDNVFETQTAEINAIKKRLAGPNQEIHFSKIETKLVDGLTHYANALIDLDGPGDKENPEKEQFALLQLIKTPGGGHDDWQVRAIKYPYKPASTGLQAEHKADDGHGH